MAKPAHFTLIAALLALASCASIDPHPFKGPNSRQAYSMDCSGMGRTLHACYEMAGKICPNGYQIVDQRTGIVAAGNVAAPQHSLAIECR